MSGPFIFDPIYLFRIGAKRETERDRERDNRMYKYIGIESVLLFIFFAGRWPLYIVLAQLDHNRVDPGTMLMDD